MRVRKTTSSGDDKIELQMTPMIDIVFQLLTFFIMTLKIVTPEGDFNVTMPSGGSSPTEDISVDLPIHIKLTADDDGDLKNIAQLKTGGGAGESFDDMAALKKYIEKRVIEKGGPGSDDAKKLEVELDLDYGLKFEYAMAAISAISGEKKGEEVEKWIENIKFTPPK